MRLLVSNSVRRSAEANCYNVKYFMVWCPGLCRHRMEWRQMEGILSLSVTGTQRESFHMTSLGRIQVQVSSSADPRQWRSTTLLWHYQVIITRVTQWRIHRLSQVRRWPIQAAGQIENERFGTICMNVESYMKRWPWACEGKTHLLATVNRWKGESVRVN